MRTLSLFIARRYLFSRKSHSVINIISGVSAFAVAIPVAAMVILLSIFNGFNDMVQSMYHSFDPDIRVTPRTGNIFEADSARLDALRQTEGVAVVSCVLEENAIFEYRGKQYIGVMRGVDKEYGKVADMDSLVVQGEYRLQFGDMPEAFVGQGIAYALGVRVSLNDPISIYTARRGQISSLLPYDFARKQNIFPSGVFALEAEVDGKYVIVPLSFARELLDFPDKASSLAIRLTPSANADKAKQQISSLLGEEFKVESRYEQKAEFYRIMMYEKWGIYFIILLVLIVASFSLIGSLVMLIIDKHKDMQTLITMGADLRLIRGIFLREGILVYWGGALIGLFLGLSFALAQQHFGFITISAQTFIIDAYPVKVKIMDILSIVVTFAVLSYLISRFTVNTMIPKQTMRLN